MLNFYKFFVNSQFNNRHHKWGKIQKILSSEKSYDWHELYAKHGSLREAKSYIQQIYIEICEEPGKKSRPFPNFLAVDIAFTAVDEKALTFIEKESISFYKIETIIVNESYKYFFGIFDEVIKVDLNASHLVWENNQVVTKGSNIITSEIFISRPSDNFRGIRSLDVLPNILVCDEETKVKLEKSKLTGFEFKEIKVR